MAIYLGNRGFVEIQRTSMNTPLHAVIQPDDVNPDLRRFSFDFDINALVTGDQIDIGTTDGSLLGFVRDHAYPDFRAYIYVDEAGGVRLYSSYRDALNGELSAAHELVKPSGAHPIKVKTRNLTYRAISGITSYSLTTNRETVDLTSLGEEFRVQYANGLISGQGNLDCFWEYKTEICADDPATTEFPHYLARLVLRTQQGAAFTGRFFLDYTNPQLAVWYEAACIITNVAMTVSPTQVVKTQIEFVTTDAIRLKLGRPPGYLLQEDGALILQESADPILL